MQKLGFLKTDLPHTTALRLLLNQRYKRAMSVSLSERELAMDRDVRNAIDEAMIGAAAIGFCLAQTLAETDPDVARRGPDLERHLRVPAELRRSARCRYRIHVRFLRRKSRPVPTNADRRPSKKS